MPKGSRGGSKAVSGGNAEKIVNSPISSLQSAVRAANSVDLMRAYSTLTRKDMRSMTNEEKMVRAVVIDELVERGDLLYDPKIGDYSKFNRPSQIIYTNGRSYRINGIQKVEDYKGNIVDVASADLYYNGSFHPVKNYEMLKQLAIEYKEKRKTK